MTMKYMYTAQVCRKKRCRDTKAMVPILTIQVLTILILTRHQSTALQARSPWRHWTKRIRSDQGI